MNIFIDYPESIYRVHKEENPNKLIYMAMHNDYSEEGVNKLHTPPEKACGDILVRKLLSGNRGHYGCLEHPYMLLRIPTEFYEHTQCNLIGAGIYHSTYYTYINLNMRNLIKLIDETSSDVLLDILKDWSKEIYQWYIKQRLHTQTPKKAP